MEHLFQLENIYRLDDKEIKFVFRMHRRLMKQHLTKGHKVAPWTRCLTSVFKLRTAVLKAQEKKRLKNKSRNR